MRRITRSGIALLFAAACALLTSAILPIAAPTAQAASRARSEAAAVDRIKARAQRGNAHAQAMLGFMYANGRGVPQSYDAAVVWYLKSARQGDPDGQYLLGLMYDKGLGVKLDVVQAHKWLNLAAAHAPRQNRENYRLIRDAVGSTMTPEQIERAQKLAADFVPTRR